jgi:hypothetical protein
LPPRVANHNGVAIDAHISFHSWSETLMHSTQPTTTRTALVAALIVIGSTLAACERRPADPAAPSTTTGTGTGTTSGSGGTGTGTGGTGTGGMSGSGSTSPTSPASAASR